jgi:PKD repeat protein
MNRYGIGVVSVAALLASVKISAQTISPRVAGSNSVTSNTVTHCEKVADVNLTELANYYQAHPSPNVKKLPFDEGDENETRPAHPLADPEMIRTHMPQSGLHSAYLPASPSPTDTFLAHVSDGTSIPPDTHGGVDSTYAIAALNDQVSIQVRATHALAIPMVTLDNFFSSLETTASGGHGPGAYDPRVHYDPNSDRWILMADAYGQTTYSQLFIAVSATGNPTGMWNFYRMNVAGSGGIWLDFPCVGFNNRWIAISGNFFTSGGSFTNDVLYILDYTAMKAGTAMTYGTLNPSGPGSFTICPALTYDASESNMFCIENWDASSGKLRLTKVTGNIGALTLTTIANPAAGTGVFWQSSPGGGNFVPELGGGSTYMLQANDDRTNNLVMRNHTLWCAHTIFLPGSGTPNRASSMWWQIDSTGTPLQVGKIDDPTGHDFYFFPSIAPNMNNDALIGFAHSSTSIYPSCAYALRSNTDPVDSTRPVFTYRHGQKTYYQDFTGGTSGQDRWGDYSATCIDPTNNLDFWTLQESVPSSSPAAPNSNWDTWWAHVQVCNYLPAPTTGTGPASPCEGTTQTYSVGSVAGATGYTWNITPSGSGWSGTSTTNSISITIGTGTVVVTAQANNTCGPGPAYTFTVSALPLPAETIASSGTVCAGATSAVFNATATGSPSSYSWTVLGTGWSGSSSTSSLTATVGTGVGTIIVNATNSCGTGPADTLVVTPGTPPGAATTIDLPTALCSGSTGVFTTPAVTGATSYTWTVSGVGWSGTSTTNSINVTIGTGTGTITVTPVNACGTGTPFTINSIIPTVAPTATFVESTHTTTTHTVVTVTYTGAAPGGTTYSWTFGGGTPATSTSAGPVSVYWTTAGTYTISLTVDNGGCTTTYTDTIHVNHGVGIKEVTPSSLFAGIVPNPNDGSFDVVFEKAISSSVTVKLYDMLGREVYANEFSGTNNNKVSVAAGDLANGTYAVTITANGKVATQKVTIAR